MPIQWTSEKLAALSDEDLKTLHRRAIDRNVEGLKALCETERARRKPPKSRTKVAGLSESKAGQYVSEFHFVCPNESEVKKDPDGSFRTGTWVVAIANAEAAVKYSSLVALHVTKSEPSYLQGRVKAWTKQAREPKNADGELVKTEYGIEFLLEPTYSPLPWSGDSSGEKGYAWAPIPDE